MLLSVLWVPCFDYQNSPLFSSFYSPVLFVSCVSLVFSTLSLNHSIKNFSLNQSIWQHCCTSFCSSSYSYSLWGYSVRIELGSQLWNIQSFAVIKCKIVFIFIECCCLIHSFDWRYFSFTLMIEANYYLKCEHLENR